MTISENKQRHLNGLAARLANAWVNHDSIDDMAEEERPENREQAFAVQEKMLEIINRPYSGWKLGATSPTMRKLDGHDDVIPGRLLKSSTYLGNSHTLKADEFPNARFEPEFAFRLNKALLPNDMPFTHEYVVERVTLYPAIEIIANRFPKKDATGENTFKVDTLLSIADNGGGMGFIVGDPVVDWQDIDFSQYEVSFSVNGGHASENFLGDKRADPVMVVVDLANKLAKKGVAISKGEFVTTGAAAVPQAVRRGDSGVIDFGRLGRITFNLI